MKIKSINVNISSFFFGTDLISYFIVLKYKSDVTNNEKTSITVMRFDLLV